MDRMFGKPIVTQEQLRARIGVIGYRQDERWRMVGTTERGVVFTVEGRSVARGK